VEDWKEDKKVDLLCAPPNTKNETKISVGQVS
jgi:hypothetical protein